MRFEQLCERGLFCVKQQLFLGAYLQPLVTDWHTSGRLLLLLYTGTTRYDLMLDMPV